MAKICVERQHSMSGEELHSLGQKLADNLCAKLGGECHLDGQDLHYKQSGASAKIHLGNSKVIVTAELGMLMSAFAGTVESEINRVLDEQLT